MRLRATAFAIENWNTLIFKANHQELYNIFAVPKIILSTRVYQNQVKGHCTFLYHFATAK